MSGIFYGAGVGPGDPELLTVKALRVMKQCPVIAIPVSDKNFTEAAYDPTGTDPAYKRYLENVLPIRSQCGQVRISGRKPSCICQCR